MRILITGSYGQLGNELSSILKTGTAEIGPIDSVYRGAEVTAVDADTLNITNGETVTAFIKNAAPDIIFNTAAMTNVDGCESDPVTAMKVNALGARNVAAAAEAVGAKLVHVSTDYVFAGNGTAPYCEWDACAPNTVYGKSKHLGEQYTLAQCPRTFVVRTAWLYGYVGGNFVKTMLKLGHTQKSVRVVNDQRGCPTHANDLAYHLLKIALTDEYGIYHCVGKGECSWFDFASRIMKQAGLDCKVNPCTTAEFPRPAPRPAYSVLRNLMLESTVGDEMRPWEQAIDAYLKKLRIEN